MILNHPRKMKRTSEILSLSGAILLSLAPTSAYAINTFYAEGDLLLTVQKVGDGANTVYVNLGNPATLFRGAANGPDAANSIDFLDLNAKLNAAFSPSTPGGWKSDPTIYVGLASVSFVSTTNTTLVNGDPRNTLYASSARNTIGTVGSLNSTVLTVGTNTDMNTAAASIQSQNNIFADNDSVVTFGYNEKVVISPVADSGIDDKNPVIIFQGEPIQDTAYGVFAGGVQQVGAAGTLGTLGAAGEVEFAVDLYRILARGTGGTGTSAPVAGQVSGPVRTGTFEGTITIGTNGNVSFVAQGVAASAYDTWMATFPSITLAADKLATADPDGDGANNLREFGFGGNPASGSDQGIGQILTVDANADTLRDITLTVEVRTGATFSPSGNDLISATIDELTYRIEGGTDLVNWDSAVSEVIPTLGVGSPSVGYTFKTFRLNGGNGLTGKGFLRAVVVK